jgi:hypothetical protein
LVSRAEGKELRRKVWAEVLEALEDISEVEEIISGRKLETS